MSQELTAPTSERATTSLDPFAYQPDWKSGIAGLSSASVVGDPAYAFHTAYVPVAPGKARVWIRFTGLEAEGGVLALRINAQTQTDPPQTHKVMGWTVPLGEIVAAGGMVETSFAARPDTFYAVVGHVLDSGEARARDLLVTVETGDCARTYRDRLEAARTGVFGRRLFRRANPLVVEGPATLHAITSQTCTAAQFEEPEYREWTNRLDEPAKLHRKQWEFVWILQALEAHGMLRSGARGLGFGVGLEPLPALMAGRGCEIVATDLPGDDARVREWTGTGQHLAALVQLRRPRLCRNKLFDQRVTYREVDMNHIPGDLRGFDFTWSACALEHLGSIAAGLNFIRNSVECLRPGGLAVHTTEFNLTSDGDTVDNQGTVLFRKRDFERLAADLTAQGHKVSPLRFDLGDRPLDRHVDMPPYSHDEHLKLALGRFVTTSFGLIVRRGDAA